MSGGKLQERQKHGPSGRPGEHPPQDGVGTLQSSAPPNADLLLPYLLPYIAYVGIATVAGGMGAATDYVLRVVATTGLLVFFWRRYQPITGPRPALGSVAVGAVAGLVGVVLWVALVLPFTAADAGTPFTTPEFLLRITAATLIVPFVEELLFRGYLLGALTQWDEARRGGEAQPLNVALDGRSIHDLRRGAWSWVAVILSSAAFALGHGPAHWAAAFAYGLLMAALWVNRRDLVAPITAHAVTNLVLYLYIFSTGSWGLW